jgi:hypothetical protein
MADSQSPIYWQNNRSPVFQIANKYLLELFNNLLNEVEMKGVMDNIPARKDEIDGK